MLRLLKFLWTGSWHECNWEYFRKIKVYEKDNDRMPIAYEYHLKCKTCGNIKVVRV